MIRKGIREAGWVLVDKMHCVVFAGSKIKDFRGAVETIVGGRPPQHEASTGKVWTADGREYFPSVFDLKWRKVSRV